MIITQKIPTNSKSQGKNTCEYIVLHHTAEKGRLSGVLSWLSASGKASCHFVVDFDGKIYQIGEETDILWHCGLSEWQGKTNLNLYAIGIEVRGIATEFTGAQRKSVAELVKYLAKKYNIPEKNLIRHKDIAPQRKNDIHDNFWNKNFKTWEEYRKSLFTHKNTMETSKNNYEKILAEEMAKNPDYEMTFSDLSGDNILTEKQIKELMQINNIRFFHFLKKFFGK